jgi:hypothetical protein
MAGILIAVVAYRTCTVGQTMDCEVCNGHQPLEAAVRAMTLAILDEDIVMKECVEKERDGWISVLLSNCDPDCLSGRWGIDDG